MASGAEKPAAFALLVFNFFLYFIIVAAWAVNHGIEKSHKTARIFPIYYRFGNMATGYVVIMSLLSGVVGFTTSVSGMDNLIQCDGPNLHAAAASSLVTWLLTLHAMGFACQEIDIRWTDSNLVSVFNHIVNKLELLEMEYFLYKDFVLSTPCDD
ncbi:unnamed protein product [Fraxinus pennsylvanica]|uniref:Uncharacterized protein n=1 Tax=Fraxinus pennsylvanica TaxID=56036 RepID=A0AAD2E666_9LAMI|nr:unnamed protein product [Fraxinus pennsylvanica]